MKNRLVPLITFLCLLPYSAYGALSITEIMYDPEGSDSGREWVEIRNDSDSVLLTSYKLFESNTNHGISLSRGGGVVPSGGYAVIADDPAKFLQDFPSYSGILFDSSFSLSNAGEFLSLKDSGGQVSDSLTYSPGIGGNDDGTTLALVQGVWVRGDPTPGSENVVSTKPLTSSASSTKASQVTALSSGPAPDLSVFVPEERLVIAGADTIFTGSALTSSGSEPGGVMYEWSFGDGGARTGKSVTYKYAEPGFYIAVVEASNGTLFAKNRIRVHVVQPSIFVTKVQKDDEKVSVALSNPSAYELDIGSWKIHNNGLYYSIPKNTILLPRATTTLNALEFGMATATAIIGTTSVYFPGGQLLASSTYIPQFDIPEKHNLAKKDKVLGGQESKRKIKDKERLIEKNTKSNNFSQVSPLKKDRKIFTWIVSHF